MLCLKRYSTHASICSWYFYAIAIELTLEYVSIHSIKKSMIFSDFLSVLHLLKSSNTSRNTNHITTFRIRKQLQELSLLGYSIHLAWLPSHKRIIGNETADQLAKNAIHTSILH